MATFEEAITAVKNDNNFEFDGIIYDKSNLYLFLGILKENPSLIFDLSYKIIKTFHPRKYEYEAYMGEDVSGYLCEDYKWYATDLELNHPCSAFYSSIESLPKCDWEKVSKWKITMEELEITDEEK